MVTPGPRLLYNPCGGDLCLDFVNSIGRSPSGPENERLKAFADLVRWCREAGCLPASRATELARLARRNPEPAKTVLERALRLREALFRIFQSIAYGSSAARGDLEILNAELVRALRHARLERGRDGYGWIWAGAGEELDAPIWPIARAAADLLVGLDEVLIRECASEDCLWLFVDRTRNHRRRWCEMKGCGNRDKVRRHRKRSRSPEK